MRAARVLLLMLEGDSEEFLHCTAATVSRVLCDFGGGGGGSTTAIVIRAWHGNCDPNRARRVPTFCPSFPSQSPEGSREKTRYLPRHLLNQVPLSRIRSDIFAAAFTVSPSLFRSKCSPSEAVK